MINENMFRFFYNFVFLLFLCCAHLAICQDQQTREDKTSKSIFDGKSNHLKKLDENIVKYQFKNDLNQLARAYEAKADYFHQENLSISVLYYEKALELYKKVGEAEGKFRILKLLASEYTTISDYKNALKKMYLLLDIYENEKDTLKVAQTFSAIGSLYADLNDNKQALEYMQKALNLSIQLKVKMGEAAIRNNIAGVYKDLGQLDRAFENVSKAEKLNKEAGNEYWLSINYMLYADLYSKLNKMDSARYYLFRSNEYTIKKGSLSDSLDMFRKTGIYYHRVDSVQKALNMFNQGILVSRRLGSLKSEANFTHWISEVYESNGKMDQALSFLQIRHDLLDSLAKRQSGKRLEEYQVLYKVKALESDLSNSTMQINLARNEADQNRHRFYWVLGVLLVVLFGSLIIGSQFRKQEKSNRHLLELNIKASKNEESTNDKYAQSNLSDSKKEEILQALVGLMVSEKMYMDQEIKLDTVASNLGVSRTYLSQVINETYAQNFTAYINSYRVNLAKKYLLSEEHDKYSIQGIAEMVGFKSVSAFNTSFKKFTGLAPSYYRRNGKGVK